MMYRVVNNLVEIPAGTCPIATGVATRGHHQHTCQVLGKSKSEIACAPLIFVYNLVIESAEKSGAEVLRVRFFLSLNRHKLLTHREIKQYCFA